MSTPTLDAQRFFIACLLGLGLGLYYGFLRPLRPKYTLLSDLLFLPPAFYAWLYLSFAICRGDIRLGYSMGLLVGVLLFDGTVGRWLRPVFQSFWGAIGKVFRFFYGIIKKFLKNCKKLCFFSFQAGKNKLQ